MGMQQRVEIVKLLVPRRRAARPRRADIGAHAEGVGRAGGGARARSWPRVVRPSSSPTSSTSSSRSPTAARCCADGRVVGHGRRRLVDRQGDAGPDDGRPRRGAGASSAHQRRPVIPCWRCGTCRWRTIGPAPGSMSCRSWCREGEILGVAGVDGNGQDELVDVLIGLRQPTAGEHRDVGCADGRGHAAPVRSEVGRRDPRRPASHRARR